MSKSKNQASKNLIEFAELNDLNYSKIERSFNEHIANIIGDKRRPYFNYYNKVLGDVNLQNDIAELNENIFVHVTTLNKIYDTLDNFRIHFDCPENATRMIVKVFERMFAITEKAKITKLRQMFK